MARRATHAAGEVAADVVERGIKAAEIEVEQARAQRTAGRDIAAGGEIEARRRQRADIEAIGIAQGQHARRAVEGVEVVAGLTQRHREAAGIQHQRAGAGGTGLRHGRRPASADFQRTAADRRSPERITGGAGDIGRAVAGGGNGGRAGGEVDAVAAGADVAGGGMRGQVQRAGPGVDGEDVAAAVGIAAGMEIERGGTIERQRAAQSQQAGAVRAAKGQARQPGLDDAIRAVPEIALRQAQRAGARTEAEAGADAIGLERQRAAGLDVRTGGVA